MNALPRTVLRLHLDPIACEGHGLCADLLPEHIALDEWGYPILDDLLRSTPIAPGLVGPARAAVAACPTLALRLRRDPAPARQPGRPRRHPADAADAADH
ncbi:MAG: hypothetical protein ABT15_17605 [Pseudonocardia sp. SCN 73-27]|uniref:ferredoxin n=1 Tax=unclassified Pseudonocardia TaxID=2619320 RepID=UPI00086CF14D|nr:MULTISPECIES: ferredoxin [unclassified Pseudonocardia]ODU26956.1 MAG: hypothetical protein ABS80_05020 [Pseudonocardia sp. SCN 72-51]ODV05317.1 MAG: hypothetical protein ABT15_17605 [Pseudonocardia sp. SCN 73-27]